MAKAKSAAAAPKAAKGYLYEVMRSAEIRLKDGRTKRFGPGEFLGSNEPAPAFLLQESGRTWKHSSVLRETTAEAIAAQGPGVKAVGVEFAKG